MPQPCTAFRVAPWTGSHRSFRHRHTLRRLPWGIGRPRPRAEALRLCRLRSLAVATPESSAPTSGIATRPLRLHACHPDAALRLPSLSLSLHCRWRAVLLAHSLTLMPTRAFHSADAMLLVLHRQSTRERGVRHYVPHVVICPAMLAHRRVETASCHTDTRFLGPGIGAAVGITSQLAVPAATLRGGEPPLSTARNLAVRADHPHTHPSYCCGCTLQSL